MSKPKSPVAENKNLLTIMFVALAFIFALFCLIAYFGGIDMTQTKQKVIISIIIGIIAIVAILFVVFFPIGEVYDYSNVQEISDSGITLAYTGENKYTKICFVKYYDESELAKLAEQFGKGDIIYISKDTPIEKSFFDGLENFDYKVRFPNSSAKIEIIGKKSIPSSAE